MVRCLTRSDYGGAARLPTVIDASALWPLERPIGGMVELYRARRKSASTLDADENGSNEGESFGVQVNRIGSR